MSPSWRNRVLVGLAPDRVAAIHVPRGWRSSPTASALRDCVARASEPWAGALAALDEALDELPQQGGGASVALSNQLVRYVQVPWTAGVYSVADRHALALSCFRSVYGDSVGGWRVVVDASGFGRAALAAAVDEALVASLRETLARRSLRLVSLLPHLATSLRRCQGQLHAGDGGFVVVEPGCVTALFRRDNAWSEVTNRRCRADIGSDSGRTLVQCVDADSLRGGEGAIALVASRDASIEQMADGRPIRRLTEGVSPWPADPWRTLAWSAA